MIGVSVGRVVQNNSLGEIPPEDAEIFDVVAKNAGTIILIQAMSTRKHVHVHNTQHSLCKSEGSYLH